MKHIISNSAAFLAVVILFWTARPVVAQSPDSDPRLRLVHPSLASSVATGVSRSATFRQLLADLDASDIVAYVALADSLPTGTGGRITFVGAAAGRRYVHIAISIHLTSSQRTALIAHELRHALEIASAPEVADGAGMARLYRTIGFASGFADSYDTDAAIQAGREVEADLRHRARRETQE